jgi:DNA polymerase (family X)
VGNRERALEIFAVASLLEARGANPYRIRAYQRAALRLLRLQRDAADFLNDRGELVLPGLGARLRRKLGELVRTGHLSFHDELLAAEPRCIRTLMTVPGIGPKTADRLVSEAKVRGLKGLVRSARRGRLRRLNGIGPAREQAWAEAAETLIAATTTRRIPRETLVQGALFEGDQTGSVTVESAANPAPTPVPTRAA